MRTFGLALLLASAVVMPCLAQGSSESRRASLESTARNLAKEYATGNPKPISGAAESGVHDRVTADLKDGFRLIESAGLFSDVLTSMIEETQGGYVLAIA